MTTISFPRRTLFHGVSSLIIAVTWCGRHTYCDRYCE